MANHRISYKGSRAALKIWCGAVLLLSAPAAHPALFDDDEARRQIAVEKKRVDDLKAQQETVYARIGKLEDALKSQPLLDLFTQLEALKLELNKLRGQIEVLNNNVENTSKRQRDMYVDLDTRLRRFEQQPAAAAASDTAVPAAVATAPSGATAASPGAQSAPADPAAETRVYEAAQSLRRVGNYQGAIVAFQNFIKQYPKGNFAPRAQYWIGDSYFNLRDYRLAIASQQALIKNYPDSPTVPDALLNIASSQIEMGESTAGKKTLEELMTKYPISDAADKARRRLAALNAAANVPPPGKP
ncbi:MAG TPA: tol-pal system protein YbgF [Burkholderiales bacterium]|nr:tol-pal system protein YbgF [Burkholderiales bacterium]